MADYDNPGLYKSASLAVENWATLHTGETFDLDTICRHLEIHDSEKRKYISIKLSYDVKTGKLEKLNKTYKYVNKEINVIDWVNASEKDELPVSWPCSRGPNDNSKFGFDSHITIRPADLIVVAGLSNWGKSTFARNFLAENLDQWDGRIQMMVNEYSPGRFKSVMNRMNWIPFLYDDGTPRFRLIQRREDWQYAIEPDWLNIIDWIGLTDNFYLIRHIMEDIQKHLKGGAALIILQKREGKTLGEGGGMTEDLASAYFLIDNGILTVRKVKESKNGLNPNGATYGFAITNGGADFSNIRPVKMCPRCGGKKQTWVKGDGTVNCESCNGMGYVDR